MGGGPPFGTQPSAGFAGTLAMTGEPARPAAIQISSGGIEVMSNDGQRQVRVAYADMQLEMGGFDGNVVYVRSRDGQVTAFSSDPKFASALRQCAPASLEPELHKLKRGERKHNVLRWIGIGSIVSFLLICVLIVWSIPRMLAASIDALPIEIDKTIGDNAMSENDFGGPVVDSPEVEAFIREIVDRLEPEAKVKGFDYRITVVKSEVVNAFALPGGRIVVFTGLIEKAESPDEVAGVLAHEFSHVTLRHGLRNVAHSAGTYAALTLLLGDGSGWVLLAGQAAAIAHNNFYSQGQEAAADAEGVRMMLAAGLPAEGLATFFEKLKEEPGSELPGAMSWMSTHPDHQSRIDHVHELMKELPAGDPRPLKTDWAAVKAAVAAL